MAQAAATSVTQAAAVLSKPVTQAATSLFRAGGPSASLAGGSVIIPSSGTYFSGNTQAQLSAGLNRLQRDLADGRIDATGLVSLMQQCTTGMQTAAVPALKNTLEACVKFLKVFKYTLNAK